MSIANISYQTASLSDVEIKAVPSSAKNLRGPHGRKHDVSFVVNGSEVKESRRFWHSFNQKFRITDNVFNLFTHEEVFTRIASGSQGKEPLSFAVEDNAATGQKRMLAVVPASKTIVTPDEAAKIAADHGGSNLRYGDGVVSVDFAPLSGEGLFKIGGDEFKNRFSLDIPLDGFGKPLITLSLLRLVCLNGMVAKAPFFRSEVNMGNSLADNAAIYTLEKAVASYDNEKGYDILARRIGASQKSVASVAECQAMHDFLVKNRVSNAAMGVFRSLTGNVVELYGVSNSNYISRKKQAQLPTKARVYDLINFATEVASHHGDAQLARVVSGYVGSMISGEFDLEGTGDDKNVDFTDLFLGGVESVIAARPAPLAAAA